MVKRLFLLDGMALVYRAHFAFISRPILTSKGVNTSALYGFTQTLLDILGNRQPTHLAVAFDTEAPTARHVAYPEYKATRQAMPEELAAALPHVRRMVDAFNIPVLAQDGFEADDLIGTLARRAEQAGFETFMVTPDKDFGQLVDARTFIYKPGRAGDEVEIVGVPEILNRWGIQRPEQVVDVLALMGDASDNVPGVPGIGEKTAVKLIAEFGSVENLLANTARLKGRLKESVEANRDLALLSKQLVTILCDAPCPADLESLKLSPPKEDEVKRLLVEFEFNSIGRRLFGEDFKAGRGFQAGRANLAGAMELDVPAGLERVAAGIAEVKGEGAAGGRPVASADAMGAPVSDPPRPEQSAAGGGSPPSPGFGGPRETGAPGAVWSARAVCGLFPACITGVDLRNSPGDGQMHGIWALKKSANNFKKCLPNPGLPVFKLTNCWRNTA
jgi:5'-3' exonuclease